MLYILHFTDKENLYESAKTLAKRNKKVFTIEREIDEYLYDVTQLHYGGLLFKEDAIKQAQRHNADYILVDDTNEYQELLTINTPIIEGLHNAIKYAKDNHDDELMAKYQDMLEKIYDIERKI